MPITEIRVAGLKTLERVSLSLNELTVITGNSGSGKSTLLKALDILQMVPKQQFLDKLHETQGSPFELQRNGTAKLAISVTIVPSAEEAATFNLREKSLQYSLVLAPSPSSPHFFCIEIESIKAMLDAGTKICFGDHNKTLPRSGWVEVLWRRYEKVRQLTEKSSSTTFLEESNLVYPRKVSLLSQPLSAPRSVLKNSTVRFLQHKLSSIYVQGPIRRTAELWRGLIGSYHKLKGSFGEQHWRETLDYVRLGLGQHVSDLEAQVTSSSFEPGDLIIHSRERHISAAHLSDGMFAYLIFVVWFRLPESLPSLLAFDSPDLHMDSQLLRRTLSLFEHLSRRCPLLITTHSNEILDGLPDPVKSIAVCSLNSHNATEISRLDPEAFSRWCRLYLGFGDIRAAGHEASVLSGANTHRDFQYLATQRK